MKMNAIEITARREQIKTTRANIKTVARIYCETIKQTPAETVAEIVAALGYDAAREAVAEIVNTVGSWDGRIWPSSREWAATIETAATRDELEAKSIYQPAEIHPAHINQLAQAMSKYAPQEQEAPVQEAQDTAEIMQQAGAVELPQRVALYVPGTQGTATATDNAAQVERVAAEFSRMFGGATAATATGYWMSESAGLVEERTTIVYAACTEEQFGEHLAEVVELAQQIKREMRQEAVTITIDQKTLVNTGDNDYSVFKGDKIAQLILIQYHHAQFVQVNKLDETERGDNGFGSTGR